MTNFSSSPVTKTNRLQIFKQLPPKLVIGGGVFLLIVILWFLVLKPLQQTLELRLQKYPAQLLSIQELNQTLSLYKNKDLRLTGLSEEALAAMQQKLLSQGLKFTLVRLENTNSVQLNLNIEEIEFSRWLELLVDFRKNYGLYANDVIIKKNEGIGVIQVSATLVQAR
jgi:type II secretory pathway component PulM